MTKERVIAVGELLSEFVAEGTQGGHELPGIYRGPFPSGAPGIFIDQVGNLCGASPARQSFPEE